MKKILLVLGLIAGVTQLFALSNYMKDSIFIVKGNIRDFSEAGIGETIVGSRVASSNPLELNVGDIFVDVNGNAQKVTKIVKQGKNISIETETPEVAEVFKYIDVPYQVTDFNDYGEDAVTYASHIRSADSIKKADGPMLDALMPEDSKSYGFTINFSKDINDYTDKVNDEVKNLEKLADAAGNAGDSKKEKSLNNMSNMLKKKNLNNSATANLDISCKLQYKKTKNNLDYSYKWSLPGFNTHGSRWPWKWTWDSGGGYAFLGYDNDFDIGLSIDFFGYVDNYLSIPIPYLAYGAPNWGPYVGVYFDVDINGGLGVSLNFYKHFEAKAAYQKDFNFYFASKGEPKKEAGIWAPGAFQIYGSVGGELTMGPSVKLGFVALGVTLAEAKASAGGYAEGEICVGYTKVFKDEDGAKKLCGGDAAKTEKFLKENTVLNKYNEEKGVWEPKCEEGCTYFGSWAAGLFAKINFEIWDGKWSTTPLDYKIPIISDSGFNNSLLKGDWFENMEGSDWYSQMTDDD